MRKNTVEKIVLATLLASTMLSAQVCSAEEGEMAQTAIAMQMQPSGNTQVNNDLLQVKKNGKWGIINTQGQEVIPCTFDNVSIFAGNLGLISVSANKKVGVYDFTGKQVVGVEYNAINPYSRDFLVVAKDKKWGALNGSGQVIIPLEMTSIKVAYLENMVMTHKDADDWKFYDLTGKELFSKNYKNVQGASEGLISVVNDKKQVGFINTEGQEVVPPIYKEAFDFTEGRALVKNNENKLAMLDKTGKVVANLPGKDLANGFREGIATVRDGNTYSAIDTTGKVLFNVKANGMQPFSNGVACIERNVNKMNFGGLALSVFSIAAMGGTGLAFGIGGDGSFSLGAGDPYYYGRSFDHHYYNAGYNRDLTFEVNYQKYKLGFVDKKGVEIIPTKNDFTSPMQDGKILVKVKGKYGYVNGLGDTIVPTEFDDISYFTPTDSDVVAVGKDEKYAFYQLKKGISTRWYAKVKPFNEGLAAVDLGENNWVYIDRSGNRLGQIVKYQEANDYSDGVATVQMGTGKFAVLDKAGNKIIEPTSDYKTIAACRKGLIPVKDQNNKWGFLNKEGKSVIAPEYEDYRM